MPTIDRPREPTVKQLYALSMNRCAYPDCPTPLVSPETGTVIGEVCHIRAHNVGGPRYIESQTDQERHGFDNLILMCRNHHKEIDAAANVAKYTVEWLLDTERAHEDRGRESGIIAAPSDVVTALIWTDTVYEAGATHMDFRNTVFKVGGEGGTLAGGGGSGGVLTIVGITHLPPAVESEMKIDLAGQAGQFPGSGGGGAGVLVFRGRPATQEDVDEGLRVPLLFPADASHVANGLLYVLGAGWTYYQVDHFPCTTTIVLVLMAESGSIDPNVLLGFEVFMADPAGAKHKVGTVDVGVPNAQDAISRANANTADSVSLAGPGVHTISIESGGATFAQYAFEVKLR